MKMLALSVAVLFGANGIWAKDQVDNGAKPKVAPIVLQFNEDLRLSSESGEDYHLWSGSSVSVEVNDAGHMFVVDTGGNRILEFDQDGRFLRQLGGKGVGPGEFQGLYNFCLLKDDGAVAFENDQNSISFSYFGADFKFVKKIVLTQGPFLQAAVTSPDGRTIAATYMDGRARGQFRYVKSGLLNRERQPILELSQADRPLFDQTKMTSPQWWSEFMGQWFKLGTGDVGVMAFGPAGEIYTANADNYRITRLNADYQEELVITRDYKPIYQSEEEIQAFVEPVRDEVLDVLSSELKAMITDQVIERAIEYAEIPARKRPIFGILPMEGKRFLVIHDYNPLTRRVVADLFDAQGRYRGQSVLPPISVNLFGGFFGQAPKLTIKGGYAYATIPDEYGDYAMVRYKVTESSPE